MGDKSFVWTSELNKKLFELRFENDWLFQSKKQPWSEFYKLLLENGFPQEMTIDHVRKKWSYNYDMYKIAKKTNSKKFKYLKLFDKHLGKNKFFDKYESWTDEWRLKLIMSITEAKESNPDILNMWRTVETSLRSQEMPIDCCIQDIQGLWHHIKMTFNRKHRIKVRKGSEKSDWPLYDAVLCYLNKFDPDYVTKLVTEPPSVFANCYRDVPRYLKNKNSKQQIEKDFFWTKDITESFIQIRLQHDWLFKQKKWAWKRHSRNVLDCQGKLDKNIKIYCLFMLIHNFQFPKCVEPMRRILEKKLMATLLIISDLSKIMIEEYGFPKTLTARELGRKWTATFGEYQKAKATNNTSWVYYQLFELYLGESTLSINPLVGWQEEWVFNFISSRTDYEQLFTTKEQLRGWREVEKRLRSIGLPLDHSLLDLPEMWTHLLKTFRWKEKFAKKGILNEHWPYFEAMGRYIEVRDKYSLKKQKEQSQDHFDDVTNDDDFEDDIKLTDLRKRLQFEVEPKFELGEQCRACSSLEATVDVFEQTDDDGLDLAYKLKVIAGIEVDRFDNLPTQICLNCHEQLQNAYKFRRKCQDVDKQFRCASRDIKMEVASKQEDVHNTKEERDVHISEEVPDTSFDPDSGEALENPQPSPKKKKVMVKTKRKQLKYHYWKICEICGKYTRNLVSHLDTHATDKTYSCDVCDKKFKFKSGLVLHKPIHNPTPRKTCEVCGKAFHILAQYRRHFVYHANERKYECETCGKRFNTIDILRVHARTHTDERPFSCQECGKTFRTAGCVSRHKKIVHRNIRKN